MRGVLQTLIRGYSGTLFKNGLKPTLSKGVSRDYEKFEPEYLAEKGSI
jgi:hypothetical protein